MPLLIAVFVVLVVVTVGLGVLAHRCSWSVRGGPSAWGACAARRIGALPAAVAIALVGWVATFVVVLGLGFLARALENPVDRPTYRWISAHAPAHELFTRMNGNLTYMGNTPVVQLVAAVAVVLLVCVYRGRRWLPVVAVGAAFAAERFLQRWLAELVDRGHPPGSTGTYPSGGVGRLLGVYSAIVVLVIVAMPAMSRAWRAGLWTGLGAAGVMESFSRLYLSKHWLTDALFGLPFGALLGLTAVATVSALATTNTAGLRGRTARARRLERGAMTETSAHTFAER